MRSLHETLSLEKAVKTAGELTDPADTLIIVTADHSHTFAIGGYADRLADITGEVLEGKNVYLAYIGRT